jgi:hypothetical protein
MARRAVAKTKSSGEPVEKTLKRYDAMFESLRSTFEGKPAPVMLPPAEKPGRFPSLLANVKLPAAYGLTTAAEKMGVPFEELLSLIRAGKIEAVRTEVRGHTLITEGAIEAWRRPKTSSAACRCGSCVVPLGGVAVCESPATSDVGIDLRKTRWRIPSATKPKEVLKLLTFALEKVGEKLPELPDIPADSTPEQVMNIVRKARRQAKNNDLAFAPVIRRKADRSAEAAAH